MYKVEIWIDLKTYSEVYEFIKKTVQEDRVTDFEITGVDEEMKK